MQSSNVLKSEAAAGQSDQAERERMMTQQAAIEQKKLSVAATCTSLTRQLAEQKARKSAQAELLAASMAELDQLETQLAAATWDLQQAQLQMQAQAGEEQQLHTSSHRAVNPAEKLKLALVRKVRYESAAVASQICELHQRQSVEPSSSQLWKRQAAVLPPVCRTAD